jgi:hypothetical protein
MQSCKYLVDGEFVCTRRRLPIREDFVSAFNVTSENGSMNPQGGSFVMSPGDTLPSLNGNYYMEFAFDGNLNVKNKQHQLLWKAPLWTSSENPVYAVMQGDGNLALYKSSSPAKTDYIPYWASGTWAGYWNWQGLPYKLLMKDDGSLIIVNNNNIELWRAPISNTLSGFTLSIDGKTLKYDPTNNALRIDSGIEILWNADTRTDVYNSKKNRVALQDSKTGRYVRHAGYVMWMHGFSANNFDFAWHLISQNDGSVMIYNDFGGGTWVGYDPNADNKKGQVLIVSSNDPRIKRLYPNKVLSPAILSTSVIP